jgi:hypothetical protein
MQYGKGSRARPLSVSKETFNDNWDKIFKKPEVVEEPKVEVISNSHGAHASIEVECMCRRCTPKERLMDRPAMILCNICGNKRCPHATDHYLECTNSNEPGQNGSIYSDEYGSIYE